MKSNLLWIVLVLLAALLLAGCASEARVGELRTESQSVELGDAKSVRVEIDFGAGELDLTGGAEKLLEADFTYNVARLKPEVRYTGGTLILRQPEVRGLPALQGLTDFRNEWALRLNEEVPTDLSVNMGAGTSDLQLADLSLNGLDISLGAGNSTIDLSSDWMRDLDVTIDAGAANITVRLPGEVGVRVKVETAIGTIDAPGLTQEGDVYTNAAYGVSEVTLQIDLEAGVGQINLEVEAATARQEEGVDEEQTQEDPGSAMISGWVWHDLCDSGQDGEPAPVTTPPGCVEDVSALGNYHADGLMAINEPLIEGVVVTLGEGICPSTGMAEISTITTDLSYDFGSLKAGSYCVSIDPQREPNLSILRPGEWTYPAVEQGVIGTTVTLYPDEYRGMVNFGWDYQFQP